MNGIENIELTQEQLKLIDKYYQTACEKIAALEKELEKQKKIALTLTPGDSVWCILNINSFYRGIITLKEIYLDVPVLRKVNTIVMKENAVKYNLIDPKYNLIDRSITNEDIGVTAFLSYKDAYAQILANQNKIDTNERKSV